MQQPYYWVAYNPPQPPKIIHFTLLQLALQNSDLGWAEVLLQAGADPWIGGSSHPLPVISLAEKAIGVRHWHGDRLRDLKLLCDALTGRTIPSEVRLPSTSCLAAWPGVGA